MKVGAVVTLWVGHSYKMTVNEINGDMATCLYFLDSELHTEIHAVKDLIIQIETTPTL